MIESVDVVHFVVVSIPHRYGKNKELDYYGLYFLTVSIPHRYGKNVAQTNG